MKLKSISIHALPLLIWVMSVVVYIYSQNNIYSCLFVLLLLFFLSKNYLQLRWRDLLYSWILVSVGLMIFYGLFLHDGDTVIYSIPGKIPLISGIISLNSVLYGFFLGGSLSLALFMFSLFSNFLKNQRPRFYFPGIWSNISILFSFLSYFVSFFLHHREEFQLKIKNRGLELSAFSKLKLFLHDASFHALESAFSFAETLEMRGFNRNQHNVGKVDSLSLILVVLLMFFLIFYRVRHDSWILLVIFLCIVGLVLTFHKLKMSSMVSQKYQYSFTSKDWILTAWSLIFISVCLYHSFIFQSYLSKSHIQEYFKFHTLMHGLFLFHVLIAIKLFSVKENKT